jgi:N-acetyl sugar amidotransferase
LSRRHKADAVPVTERPAILNEQGLWPAPDHEAACQRCVMMGSKLLLDLDAQGICAYCRSFDAKWPAFQWTQTQVDRNLQAMVKEVRARKAKGSNYDCLIGLSGGVDSSYVALLCMRLGLRPLAVHFDNGWNSKTAVDNIRRIVDQAGFDLETYVIDWEEFRDLQRAYLKAGVVDIEALTDHAIAAAMFRLARKNRIKTVLSGSNFATEHGIPVEWSWSKQDWRNIKAIHRQFGERRLKSFPHMGSLRYAVIDAFSIGGRIVRPLDLAEYRKTPAMQELQEHLGWQYYGGKHYESTWTKFYQAYILPLKFGVDKRLPHLSAQVRIGELPRNEAMEEAQSLLYSAADIARDKRFVCKKLGFSEEEFDALMSEPPRSHRDYPTDERTMAALSALRRRLWPR